MYELLIMAALVGKPDVKWDGPPLPQGRFEVSVHDGDSIRFGEIRIRLHGIDAPELSQTCQRDDRFANTTLWTCGKSAREYLKELVVGGVICEQTDYDSRYKRPVAICYNTEGVDIGKRMVAEGWALAYRRYSDDYVGEETVAKHLAKGMWAHAFIKPWDWRKGERWQ
jgi:endonuclease YncB( thermonuclease family)